MSELPHQFDDAEAVTPTPEAPALQWHAAWLRGTKTPAYTRLLGTTATLMLGEVWGQHDRRNTPDGEWQPVTLTWEAWIEGGPAKDGNPAWGFSRHPIGKHKEGVSVVLGSSELKSRKAKEVEYMYALGLDLDSGVSFSRTIDKIEQLGLFCIAYTTFNDGKDVMELDRDHVLTKTGITTDPTADQIKAYLASGGKDGKTVLEPEFIAAVEIEHQKKQIKGGVKIILKTPTLDKFRLIFPLETPMKLIDLDPIHAKALEVWEDAITGFAHKHLGVTFDTSCTDSGRVYYTPRHPKGSEDHACVVVQGDPLRFEDIKPMKKAAYIAIQKSGGGDNPFLEAGGTTASDLPPQITTDSGLNLNKWHSRFKARFMVADMLEQHAPDKLRLTGSEPNGAVTIECPYESEHTSEGGSAAMAINCINADAGFWTVFCHHAACQGRWKGEFLNKMLQDWGIEESLLTDIGEGYLLPPGDQDIEDDAETTDEKTVPQDRTERHAEKESEITSEFEKRASEFTKQTTDAELEALMVCMLEAGAGESARQKVKEIVEAKTVFKAAAYNRMWRAAEKAHKLKAKRKPKSRAGDIEPIDVMADFEDRIEYAQGRIHAANAASPSLFRFGDAYATPNLLQGQVSLLEAQNDFYTPLAKVTRWLKITDNDMRTVAPPDDVVKYMYNDPEFISELPELLGVVTTPFFAANGDLVLEPGYHAGARVILEPGDLKVARVSEVPTKAEVADAVKFLIEEVIADFPLAGKVRAEIMAAKGDDAAVIAHSLALMLLPMARSMIAGATPGHVITKPEAGTGATMFVDVCSLISMGSVAPAMSLPDSDVEVGKSLTSLFSEGANIIFYDNVKDAVSSTELASAMTGKKYRARLLGRSATVEVAVRVVWVFTANNFEGTKELLRRFIFIPMDAMLTNPEERVPVDGWRHPDLMGWVEEHRAELVHACLTIIQSWVAKGMLRQTKVKRGGFEDWSAVMGGILENAGIEGFLCGQKEEQDKARDDGQEGQQALVDVMAEYPSDTTWFRPGSSKPPGAGKDPAVNIQDLLNGADRFDLDSYGDAPSPIVIDNWGYKDFTSKYENAVLIGRRMVNFARKPHLSGDWIIHLEMSEDNHGKKYRMWKEPVKVKLTVIDGGKQDMAA